MTISKNNEKTIPFLGQNNVTVRVPHSIKEEIGKIVQSERDLDPDLTAYDKIARAVRHRGL